MKSITSILLVLMLVLQGCDNNDNDCNLLCFTPPRGFSFELVDKTSGENLFTNGTYKSGEIKITNTLDNNSPVRFTFNSENNINLIQIGYVGWETEIVNLDLSIAGNHIFDLYVDAERKEEECCAHTEYNEIKIKDVESEFNDQTGIYKILVE